MKLHCPLCNGKVTKTNKQLASYPPQDLYRCEDCGWDGPLDCVVKIKAQS